MMVRRPCADDLGWAHRLARSFRSAVKVILSIAALLLLFAVAVASVLGERR